MVNGPRTAAAVTVLALLLAAPKLAFARSVECTRIIPAQVTALFSTWNAALATKDPDKVVARYAPDATLLPTVETGPLEGPAAIRSYFVNFLKKSPSGVITKDVVRIGCNVAWDVGLYTFTVDGAGPGTRQTIAARYTFIYVPVHGKWLIAHQHSSIDPLAKANP